MNICIITSDYISPFRGGVEHVSYLLAKEFEYLGNTVYCVSLFPPFPKDVPCLNHTILSSNNILSDENVNALNKHFTEKKIDIIVNSSHHYSVFELCLLVKQNVHIPIISTLYIRPNAALKGLNDVYAYIEFANVDKLLIILNKVFFFIKYPLSYFLRYRYISNRYRQMYIKSNAFVLESKLYARKFKSISKIKNISKLYAISNPIEYKQINDNIIVKKKQVIFIARMVFSQKRPDRMLEIWQEIQQYYNDWQLIMIGDGNDLPRVKQYAEELHLKNIIFTGNINPEQYYRESSILCMTSTYEGFGMVLVEAQQYGCVPVAYDSYEALQDIIEDGETGFRILPFKKKDYVEKLRQLMDDEDLRERMSQKAMESCKKFDVKNIARQWIDLFEKLLEEKEHVS